MESTWKNVQLKCVKRRVHRSCMKVHRTKTKVCGKLCLHISEGASNFQQNEKVFQGQIFREAKICTEYLDFVAKISNDSKLAM